MPYSIQHDGSSSLILPFKEGRRTNPRATLNQFLKKCLKKIASFNAEGKHGELKCIFYFGGKRYNDSGQQKFALGCPAK